MTTVKKADKFHSTIIPDTRLLAGILGLRGIAALAVLLYHLKHLTGINVPDEFGFIATKFGHGVHLFFVLSAFSLMYSTEHTMHRVGWVKGYLLKRFFRIAPLFYTVIAYMLILPAIHAIRHGDNFPISLAAILINVSFVFGFFLDPLVGVVMGGWTIGVEMIFYVLFPVFLMLVNTSKQALLVFLMMSVISYAARYQLHTDYLKLIPLPQYDWSYFSFIANINFFAAGIYAYRLGAELKNESFTSRVLIPCIAISSIVLLILPKAGVMIGLGSVILAIGFTALTIWQSKNPSSWIASKFFEYTGERSYSLYLLHPVIILPLKKPIVSVYTYFFTYLGAYAFFVCAIGTLLLVLAASELTYRFIEVPGIKLGQKIIKTLREKNITRT